jgi:hypothetical protein
MNVTGWLAEWGARKGDVSPYKITLFLVRIWMPALLLWVMGISKKCHPPHALVNFTFLKSRY